MTQQSTGQEWNRIKAIGAGAHRDGARLDENPYAPDGLCHEPWEAGWLEANRSAKQEQISYLENAALLSRIKAEIIHYEGSGKGLVWVEACIQEYADRMAKKEARQ